MKLPTYLVGGRSFAQNKSSEGIPQNMALLHWPGILYRCHAPIGLLRLLLHWPEGFLGFQDLILLSDFQV
jgi:hypothetical protein